MPDRSSDDDGRRLRRRVNYPKRITLDLTEADYRALHGARHADRVPMAGRLRALSLWREDPALAKVVSARAQEKLLATAAPPHPAGPRRTGTDGPEAPSAS